MKLGYNSFKEELDDELKITEKIIEINKYLREFDFFFITPYTQVCKIDLLFKHIKNGTLTRGIVSSFFIKEFYDLSRTLSYIDGYFKKSIYIKNNLYHIERSLILCFQKEYTGAINVLIPCIEGVITAFLNERKLIKKDFDRYKKIRRFLKVINQELGEREINSIQESTEFNYQQKKHLIKQSRKCLGNWTSMLEIFINESLFSHSNYNNKGNTLNRHIILHSLENNKYDTLENYIKLFNSLTFINWFFIKIEKNSILNEIDNETFINKRLYYEKIIEYSNKTTTYKNLILKNHTLHTENELYRKNSYESIYKGLSFKLRLYFKF